MPLAVQLALRRFLRERSVAAEYALALIDCPPNLNLCSLAALVAADVMLVPVQAEDFGAQGIAAVRDFAAAVAEGPNPDLGMLGYVVTMFDARLTLHKLYVEQLRAEHRADLFHAIVPRRSPSPSRSCTASRWRSTSRAARRPAPWSCWPTRSSGG